MGNTNTFPGTFKNMSQVKTVTQQPSQDTFSNNTVNKKTVILHHDSAISVNSLIAPMTYNEFVSDLNGANCFTVDREDPETLTRQSCRITSV